MKNITKLIISLAVAGLSVASYVQAATDQSVTYQNQRGSTMTLTWHPEKANTGTLTGTLTSAVGNCKKDMNKPMPLQGFFNGNAIAVTVNFPNCKQVVAMTGNMSADQNELNTLWFDAAQSKDPTHKDWNSNVIGADYFKKQG